MNADDIDIRYALTLAPAEAVDYFKRKGLAVTDDWRDLWQAAHSRAFTVAKMAKHSLLRTTHDIIHLKLAQGWSLSAAAASLEEEFRKAGWWGQQVAVDSAGGAQVVQLGSARRIKTILRTNTNTAYAAGRYQRQVANAANRPWWRYVAIRDGVTRLTHRQLDGKILRHDDPAWQAIYPPNGFNCRCRVIALTDAQAEAAGADMRVDATDVEAIDQRVGVDKRTGEILTRPGARVTLTDRRGHALPFTPDPGWAYRPGNDAGAAFGGIVVVPADYMTGLRLPVAPRSLRRAATDADSLDMILGALSVTAGGARRGVQSPVGGKVVIDPERVKHIVYKFDEHREVFAPRIEPTIVDPDEMWEVFIGGELRTRYIKVWADKRVTLAITAKEGDGEVLFNFMRKNLKDINRQRDGKPLYRRPPVEEE